jgi:hypothetical protein
MVVIRFSDSLYTAARSYNYEFLMDGFSPLNPFIAFENF